MPQHISTTKAERCDSKQQEISLSRQYKCLHSESPFYSQVAQEALSSEDAMQCQDFVAGSDMQSFIYYQTFQSPEQTSMDLCIWTGITALKVILVYSTVYQSSALMRHVESQHQTEDGRHAPHRSQCCTARILRISVAKYAKISSRYCYCRVLLCRTKEQSSGQQSSLSME